MSADLIASRQADVIDEFALFDDWMDTRISIET